MSAQAASFLGQLDLSAGKPDPSYKPAPSFLDQIDLTSGIREDQYQPPEDKPWTSDLGEIGRQLAGGVVVGVPQQAGQALKWLSEPGKPLYETGQRWVQSAEQRAPGWEPDLEGRGPIAETLIKGAQQVGPSVAGPLAAAGLLAATPFEVPAAVGLGLGALAGAVPMGMAQGQESYENVIEAGGTAEEALKAGRINQAIETGGETLGNVALGGMLGAGRRALFPTKPVADAVRSVTDTGVLKPLAKSIGGAMVTEPLTEFGQGFGEAAVEQAYGVPNLDPVQQGLEGAQTAIGMTALGIPVGAVGHTVQARRNAAIGSALTDPATATEERSKAADILAGQIAQVDQAAAQQARANAATAIQQGLPLPLADTVASPDLFAPEADLLQAPGLSLQPQPVPAQPVTLTAAPGDAGQEIDLNTGRPAHEPQRVDRVPDQSGTPGAGGLGPHAVNPGRVDAGPRPGADGSGLGLQTTGPAPQPVAAGGFGLGPLAPPGVDPETGEILIPAPDSASPLPRWQQTGLALQRPSQELPDVATRVQGLFDRVDRGIESAVQEWENRGSEGAIEEGPVYQRMQAYLARNLAPYLGDERTPTFVAQLINGADRDALAGELAHAMTGQPAGVTNAAGLESVSPAPGNQAEQQPALGLSVPVTAPSEEELARGPDADTEAATHPAESAAAVQPELPQNATEQRVTVPTTRSRLIDEWRQRQRAPSSVSPDETPPVAPEPAPTVPLPTQETIHAQQDTQRAADDGDRRPRLDLRPIGTPSAEGGQRVQPGGSAQERPAPAAGSEAVAPEAHHESRPRTQNLPVPSPSVPGADDHVAHQTPPRVPEVSSEAASPSEAPLRPMVGESRDSAPENRPSTLPVAPRNESALDDAMGSDERGAVRFVEGEKANTFHILGNADEIQARLRAARVPPGTKVDDTTVRLNNLARQKAEVALLPPTGEASDQSRNQAPQGAAGQAQEGVEAPKAAAVRPEQSSSAAEVSAIPRQENTNGQRQTEAEAPSLLNDRAENIRQSPEFSAPQLSQPAPEGRKLNGPDSPQPPQRPGNATVWFGSGRNITEQRTKPGTRVQVLDENATSARVRLLEDVDTKRVAGTELGVSQAMLQRDEDAPVASTGTPHESAPRPLPDETARSPIDDLVTTAIQPGRSGNAAYHVYRDVNDDEASHVQRQIGLDLRGYQHGIDEATVRHILKEHGNTETEATRGQVPVTREDFRLVPEITDPAKADSIEMGTVKPGGQQTIVYRKRYNGTTYAVEEVRSGRKRLALVTLWKTRSAPRATSKEGVAQTSDTFRAQSPTERVSSIALTEDDTTQRGGAQTVPQPAEREVGATAAPKTADTDQGENTQTVAGPPAAVETAEQSNGNPKHTTTDAAGQAGDADVRAGDVPAVGGERRAGALRGAEGGDHAQRVQRTVRPGVDGDDQREGEPGRDGRHPGGRLGAATDLGGDRRQPSRISRGNDYRIQPGELTRHGSWLDSARRNVEAVELVATLEQEQRAPTKEEQALLAQFVGWGPGEIRNNLFPPHAGIGKSYNPWAARGDQWRELGQRLKEVFTAEDWKTVARSTQYAHYTSEKIIRSIYGALGRLGFVSGSMLEPGAGIGLFAGLMPDSMYRDSTYLGIELDGFSARIAQHLFPSQTIRHGDYTRQKLPNNFFDVAIGNPPFADVKVMSDPDYRKQKFLLHDYFFAKTLDSVRPGGLLAFVTSNGTMDKKSSVARDYLRERADLLGAIRLPQTAFKDNAGTEVVTDVLFLRKRAPGTDPAGPAWKESVALQVEGTEQFVNEYFVEQPEMVLGVHSAEGSMYAGKSYTVKPIEGDIEDLFAKAVENLPQNVYSVLAPTVPIRTIRAKTIEREFNPKHRKEGGVYLNEDGELMRVEFGVGVPLREVEKKLSAKDQAFLTDYVPLRDALKQARYDQLTDGDWETSLNALNEAYEAFVRTHGPVNAFRLSERREIDEDGNESVVQVRTPIHEKRLRMDVEFTLLHPLERIKDDDTIEKGPVLKGRVLKQPTEPKIETISDALAVSLANTGAFDIDHVAQLYGVERADAVRLLGDLVYELPSGGYVMADAYLSGDVKAKLDEAVIAADHQPRYARNVEALQKVQPPQLGAADITVQLGAAWIPEKYVSIFGREVLGIDGAVARYSKATGGWTVSGKAGKYVSRSGSAEWGTNYRSPTELLDAVLNKRQIRVYDTIQEGGGKKSVFNEEATVAANDIAKRMADEFGSWVWTDSRRAGQLLTLYNETFNRYSPREFNGDHLNPPGMSLKYTLHPHQKRAVWRQIQTGNTYLAHAVGAGKTLEMIIGGMEQKRLGLIEKPMYVVPNHMLNQFAREFMEAYPAANILVADEQNFHTDNRRRFIAQAAFNAPDAIVITHSAFKILQLRPENKAAAYDLILEDLRDQLEELDGDDQMTKRSRREIENRIEKLEQQLEGKTKSEKKDASLYFEDMGVDFIYVDEAHAYRKLDYGTNMKVKGLSPEGSQQALDLYAKTRWLNSQRPGRAFAFASGTPITNSMAEMFTVQRFFQEDLLRKEGLHHFDAWASMFGRVAKFYEKNATGAIEVVERFGKFVNVYDMMSRALEFMDVLTSPQLADLIRVPDVRPGNAGRRELVSVEQSENLAQYLAGELTQRLETSRQWKPTMSQPNNPDPVIAIIGDGRLAAIDFRYVDPSLPNDPGSKLNRMCDEIIRIHQESAELEYTDPETGEKAPVKGATQIVFASNGFGEGVIRNRGFDSRAWVMKRFKDAGIKASDVAWIWDYPDAAKKEAMFKDMREGKKRILIGSPKNMGTGVNVQRRLLALHHLDAPWYPSDLEQPEGRIVRQGNQNRQVQIYGYATDGTYDSTMWTMVAQKSGFIEQAFKGDRRLRTMDDVSESSQYALAAAIASGDQRYMQLAELEAEVTRLETVRKTHDNRQLSLKRDISSTEREIEFKRKALVTAKAVAKELEGQIFYSGYLNGKIGATPLHQAKTTEVGDALLQAFKETYAQAVLDAQEKAQGTTVKVKAKVDKPLGLINGVRLSAVGEIVAQQNKEGQVEILSLHSELDVEASVGEHDIGRVFGRRDQPADGEQAASKFAALARDSVNRPQRLQQAIDEARQNLDGYRSRFGAPFAQEQEYLEKLKALEELRRELTAKEEAIDPAALGEPPTDEAEGVLPLESRGQAGTAKTHTAASLGQALRGALKSVGDIADPLLAAPWFKIVTRENSPRGIEVLHERAGEVMAWYDPASGTVGLVADAIPADWSAQELRGLMLHEIGVHMRHLGQDNKVWSNILEQFDRLEKSGDKAVGAAFRRAMRAGVPTRKLQEEALAYYVQEHPDLPFARRVLAWFRMLLRKIGHAFEGLNKARWMRWANELRPDDLVAMARGALVGSVQQVATGNVGTFDPTNPDLRYSRSTPLAASRSPADDTDGVFAEIDKVTASQGPWREEGNKIRDRWESLKGVAKRHWLGALSVRQLAEIGKSVLPGIGEYVDHMQGMAATRTQVFDRADRVAKDWGVLVPGDAARNRIEQNRLAAVMHEATLAGVDPAEEYVPIIDPKEALKKIGIIRQQMRQRSGESQAIRMQEVKFLQQQMAFERNRKEAYGGLARMFNALTPKAQDIYRRARDFHVEQSKLVEQALIEMIEQSQLGGKGKAEAIAKLRKEFESNRVQAPYFPLSRQGDYWVVLEPEEGGPVEFHMFQTVEQQERFITEQEKAGATIKGRGKQIENLREVVGVSVGFVEEVENLLKQMGNDPIVNDVRDQVYQLYLTTLPDLSVRKHFIHRKKTPGFGQDALRAFAEKAYHDAYQYARLKHGMPLRQTMEDLRADIEVANRGGKLTDAKRELALLTEFRDIVMGKMSAQEVEDLMIQLEARALEDPGVRPELEKWKQFNAWMEDWARRGRMPAFVARRTKVLERRLATAEKIRGKDRGYEFAADVYDELQAAYQQLMNPRTSPLANAVNQLGFLWYLGFSPSAWLVNAMQTPMVSLPYAAAKFGFDKASRAFGRAYRKAFKLDADNLFSIRGALSGEALKAYDEAVEIGLIDRTRAHDLAGLAEEGTQRSGLNRQLMQISSAGFHHAERLNREVTFIAGFELAREAGMNYTPAVAYAQELVWKTHLDYAAENRPRMLRGNIARIIGQFKLYSQGITYLLGKSFADALNRPGVSAETRKEARRFLAFQFGLQFAAAGALGLPVGAALMVARAMLNGDDDDPEDLDGLFRQAMMEWTGSQTAGVAVSTGLVNALTPIDLHSRLSLSDLWLREPNRELEGRDAAYWVMSSILGPMAGLLETGLVGAKLINDGQVYRGIEKMLPNALNDAAKAARYATEGAQTLKGDKLLQEITPAESLFQAIGFTPARLEARYAENQARKNVEQRVQDRRSQLLRQAAEARMARDREAIVDTNAAIRAFNEKNPARRIVGTDVAQSMRMRVKQRVQAESGAIYNPRMRRQLGACRTFVSEALLRE